MNRNAARKVRVLIFAVISAFSIFLLGGGKISGSDNSDNTPEAIAEKELLAAVCSVGDIPEEDADAWKECAEKDPQFLLQALTVELKYPDSTVDSVK